MAMQMPESTTEHVMEAVPCTQHTQCLENLLIIITTPERQVADCFFLFLYTDKEYQFCSFLEDKVTP